MLAKTSTSLKQTLEQEGYIHVAAADLLAEIQQCADFKNFKDSWNDLSLDNHLIDSGKYRYRRYSVFNSIAGKLELLPSEPHFQTREYNPMHGGSYRYYQDIAAEVLRSDTLKSLIGWNIRLISTEEQKNWRIQCHQFRICATEFEAGKPTPEGVHQDGADYVFIMLLDRQNVLGSRNTIHGESGDIVYQTTLEETGEAILLNDKRFWHGVSEMTPKDKNQKAYRDVLVLTFHARD